VAVTANRNVVRIEKVGMKALGHASLETTTRCVALAKQAQRKALQQHAL
jgi:hypothetical protein